MVDVTFVLLFAVADLATREVPILGPVGMHALTQQRPDTAKAVPLPRWANDTDLARLRFAEGKPRWLVLLVLGHPKRIERRPDGGETWVYPWVAGCYVWLNKNRVCTGTYYTAGY